MGGRGGWLESRDTCKKPSSFVIKPKKDQKLEASSSSEGRGAGWAWNKDGWLRVSQRIL